MTCRRVHAGLDHLDGDQALDRLGLLGHPDAAHAALADRLDELVRADHRPGEFGDRLKAVGRIQDCGAALEETAGRLVCLEQPFDPCAQDLITGAYLIQIRSPKGGIVLFQRRDENRSFAHGVFSRFETAASTLFRDAPSARNSRQENPSVLFQVPECAWNSQARP